MAPTGASLEAEPIERLARRFLHLLDQLDHSIVWEYDDEESRFTFVSARSTAVVGFPPEAWLTDSRLLLERTHEADRSRLEQAMNDLRLGSRDTHCEHRFRRAEGDYLWLRTGMHGELEEGHFIVRGLSIDVDDFKRSAELRERLLGMVGHDLRSPLAAIVAANSSMLKRGDLAANDARAASTIERSATRMKQMLSDLVDFTRTRMGGGLPIQPETVDLAVLCREMVEEFKFSNPTKTVNYHGPVHSNCRADRARFAQVLSNLLSNAAQYGAPGEPIEMRLQAGAGRTSIEVHNRGAPIAPEALAVIFDPFRRAAQPATCGGLGLGLFIVREIVLAHGGSIDARSTAAEGTTFTIRVPCQG
jgi:signal transduction histidine kinase